MKIILVLLQCPYKISEVWKEISCTSKSLNAGVCVTSSAEGFQSCCLCTLHGIKDPPKHRAGQSPIRHLRHKQPNAQSVRGPQNTNRSSQQFPVETVAWGQFLTFCFWARVKQLWGRDGRIPAVVCPKTECVSRIHQHQINGHTRPSDHWHSTLSF